MMKNVKRRIDKTFIKYYMSYLIIFTVCFLGFFLIIKRQVMVRYREQLITEKAVQLENMVEILEDDFLYLKVLDNSVQSDRTIAKYIKSGTRVDQLEAHHQLNSFNQSNELLSFICLVDKRMEDVLNAQKGLVYQDEKITIIDDSSEWVVFDPAEYLDNPDWQLIRVGTEKSFYLLFFPSQKSSSDGIFFYLLNKNNIMQYMETILTKDMQSFALLDQNKEILIGRNAEVLETYRKAFQQGEEIDSNDTIIVRSGLQGKFYLMTMVSPQVMQDTVNDTFRNTYLLFVLLMAFAFLVIFVSMQMTYKPLKTMVNKLSDKDNTGGLLARVEDAYKELKEENVFKGKKLEKYQAVIKKTLLEEYLQESLEELNLDSFFEQEEKEIYVIMLRSGEKEPDWRTVQETLLDMLGKKENCIILGEGEKEILFLINYEGEQSDKQEKLVQLLWDLHEREEYYSAICGGTDSPMEIPLLCKRIKNAYGYWPDQAVVNCELLQSKEESWDYPYNELQMLKEALNGGRVSEGKECLDMILQGMGEAVLRKDGFPKFLEKSILIDILATIMDAMNWFKIDFKHYQDTYYDVLYLCRNGSYVEKQEEIAAGMKELLDIYEQQKASQITSEKIKSILEDSCYQPNFSIYDLADRLGISFTYASKLVKKELGQNFSEYLWQLRLEKAKELLTDTDKTVEEICSSLGYLSVSGFRRKFKQDVGCTPNEFRAKK